MGLELRYDRPTSIFIGGDDRPTLNWCALALAGQFDPEFFWTDVRLPGEKLADTDPLSQQVVPTSRCHTVEPPALARDERSAEIARRRAGDLLRSDEPSDTTARLVGFLGLPAHTQSLLPGEGGRRPPRCVVLSNAHRLVALYPTVSVSPTVRAIVEYGATLIATFADAAPEGRWAFETVLHVAAQGASDWRQAKLTVERLGGGPQRDPPETVVLEDFPPIASGLAQAMPG